ncbi:Uma2 family endonuclease [Streptomyces fractus]|uniref:Uma2 family endonuclease n=1 Tax=Streptomyces fractus TaxID=641806 RepID=UPI003CF5DA4B
MTETPVRSTAQDEVYRHLRDYRDTFADAQRENGMFWPEIADSKLVMMMSPRHHHQRISSKIVRQLMEQAGDDVEVFQEVDTEDLGRGVLRVPDIAVADTDAPSTDTDRLDPVACRLIIEVVSRSNPDNDYLDKVRDYAFMRIPHYLIVDPRDGTCVHYWEPTASGGWENRRHYTFGESVPVGQFKIDTSVIPRYKEQP